MTDCADVKASNRDTLCPKEKYKYCGLCVSWWAKRLKDEVRRRIDAVTDSGTTEGQSPVVLSPNGGTPPNPMPDPMPFPIEDLPWIVETKESTWRAMDPAEVAKVNHELKALALPTDPLEKFSTLVEFYREKAVVLHLLYHLAIYVSTKQSKVDLPNGISASVAQKRVPGLSAFLRRNKAEPITLTSSYSADEGKFYTMINQDLLAIRKTRADDRLGQCLHSAYYLYRLGQRVRAKPALREALTLISERIPS